MCKLNSSKRRILVIDDNEAIHGDFRKILTPSAAPSSLANAKAALFGQEPSGEASAAQFELDSALQGQEGFAKLQAALTEGKPYSVAFVDMRMPPGWDGLQTIEKLWEVDSDLQVVICSAYSDYSWNEIAAKLGLTDRLLILKKPFDPMEVTQIATALSEKWSLRRAARLKLDELEEMVEQRTQELTHLALYDKLTGLANRAFFTDRLAKSVERARQDGGYRFAVLFVDFDRFKSINDSFGHEAGDEVLKKIAERLNAALKLAGPAVGDCLAARLGGDEFVILIDGFGSMTDATSFGDGLSRLLNAQFSFNGRDVHCTASIGITTSAVRYDSAQSVIRDADTAMYHAKAAGKARYCLFDRQMHEELSLRMEMENGIRGAAERGELVVHYQPIVSLSTNEVKGFEALVRWNHPNRGLLAPLEFVTCCEEIGAIVPLGMWVMDRACRQLGSWTKKYPSLSNLIVSVNLSSMQLTPDLPEQVAQVIHNTGVDPHCLALEITESVVINDAEAVIQILGRIRALGVRLYMDDFGTGYSSLSCLHKFPLDGLKIDRRFIQNVNEHRDYAAVVYAIVSLARNLGMKLIAEGIESADQVTLLQAMDCDLAQGFYFDCPRDPAGAEAYIAKHLSTAIAA